MLNIVLRYFYHCCAFLVAAMPEENEGNYWKSGLCKVVCKTSFLDMFLKGYLNYAFP